MCQRNQDGDSLFTGTHEHIQMRAHTQDSGFLQHNPPCTPLFILDTSQHHVLSIA